MHEVATTKNRPLTIATSKIQIPALMIFLGAKYYRRFALCGEDDCVMNKLTFSKFEIIQLHYAGHQNNCVYYSQL